MYAIVDIETTGGYPVDNDITELAIVLHNGINVVDRFETLVKPEVVIPYYIQVLTGITPLMVEGSRLFNELAANIYEILNGKIFVAHNVNFDYSFLKHKLWQSGLDLVSPRLCTVRLAKKVFPDLPSYSLGNLCRQFGIPIHQRHRAGGDVNATVQLFEHLLLHNAHAHIENFLKKGSNEQYLPPHLPKTELDKLPYTPGVYYFHNQKGKVIYVGKAKNLKYRVKSHFTHIGSGKKLQNFLRNVYNISFQSCGNELMAFILESIEIRRLWPEYNNSQKRFNTIYGLYAFEDRTGYQRLVIDRKRKNLQPLYTFNLLVEAHRLMHQLIKEFHLCPKLCFMQTSQDACIGLADQSCNGACEGKESSEKYNLRAKEAIHHLNDLLPTFAVVEESKHDGGQSCILVEKGKFYGMGIISAGLSIGKLDDLKSSITQYPENDYIRNLIYSFVNKNPQKKILLTNA